MSLAIRSGNVINDNGRKTTVLMKEDCHFSPAPSQAIANDKKQTIENGVELIITNATTTANESQHESKSTKPIAMNGLKKEDDTLSSPDRSTCRDEKATSVSLPMRKRKQNNEGEGVEVGEQHITKTNTATETNGKKRKNNEEETIGKTAVVGKDVSFLEPSSGPLKPIKRAPMTKAREIRLEQNRKAARESRRRKKVMIEELQRSVIFFSRANGTLKQRNEELESMLLNAKAQIQALQSGENQAQSQKEVAEEKASNKEAGGNLQPSDSNLTFMGSEDQEQNSKANIDMNNSRAEESEENQAQAQVQHVQAQQAVAQAQAQQQAQAQASHTAATQAMFESHGFPPAAARAVAHTFITSAPVPQVTNATVEGSGSSGVSNVPGVSLSQQAQQIVETQEAVVHHQQQAAQVSTNSWPFLLAMQPSASPGNISNGIDPDSANAPLPAQATARSSQAFQEAMFAMQHYNTQAMFSQQQKPVAIAPSVVDPSSNTVDESTDHVIL